ncbi:MAG: VanW family protein [Actinomycetia bacterium]|nr:VanW family protein [Actinomycetes bacterium]
MKSTRTSIFILVPLVLFLLPLAIYVADTTNSTDQIARNVAIAELPVGGLARSDATLVLEAYQSELRQSPGTFTALDQSFELNPLSIGLTAAIDSALDEALQVGRSGNMVANFASWLRSFGSVEDVPLTISFSDDAIDTRLTEWEKVAITNPAFEGSVTLIDGVVVPEYPQTGDSIEKAVSAATIKSTMSTLNKATMPLTISTSEPTLTDDDIDAAVAEMEQMIDSEITLTSNEVGVRVSFTPHDLEAAVRADLSPSGDAMIVSFDEHGVLHVIDPLRSKLEREPVDATFDVELSTNEISMIPGRDGTLIDMESLLPEMKRAALGDGTGIFPLVVGAEPKFTTADATAALPDMEFLGGFTTEHPAGQDRVTNIQTMARAVDGAIVLPGHEWSINEQVGIRTEAKGYVAAPAIINGEPYCCDHPANIGGGVSQFGTTLYNAIFFSCLEDVEHQPHSLRFSRYPSGREATLGFPSPDVRLKNNTEFPVVIKTQYRSTSISVKMFGNNGGKKCTDVTYEPEAVVEAEEELVADPEGKLLPGQKVKDRNGINGYLQRVDRVVTYPDGRQETDLKLVWRYRPLTTRYFVNACEVSGEPINCPVKIPSVIGQTWEQALATLSNSGMLAAKQIEAVDDPAKDNVVLSQTPGRGEWLKPGTTVTVTVGSFSEG